MPTSGGMNLQKFKTLPVNIQEALVGPEAIERMEAIEGEYGVRLMEPLVRLACGELRWSDFSNALVAQQGVQLARARAAADRVLEDLLASIIHDIDPTVPNPTQRLDDVLDQIERIDDFPTLDDVARRRLRAAAGLFLREVRDEKQTRDAFMRGPKVGGVGLEERQVEPIIAAMRRYRGRVTFVEQQDGRGTGEALALGAEEEEEVQRAHPITASSGAGDIHGAADRVIARVGAKFKHEEAAKRFRSAIESRLRDIRDHQETFDILTRATAAGGLGIPAERVEKVLAIVEEEFGKLHPKLKPIADSRKPIESVIASEAKPVSRSEAEPRAAAWRSAIPVKQSASAAPVPTPGLPRPSFASATEGHSAAAPRNDKKEEGAPVALPSPPPLVAKPMIALPPPPPVAELVHPVPPTKPIANSRKPIESAVTRPTAASRQPQASVIARPRAEAIPVKKPPATAVSVDSPGLPRRADIVGPPRNDKKVEPLKPKPVPPTRPQDPTATPPTSAPPSLAPSGRPKLQDIRSVPPRLIGPVEELGRLTLDDFRKIARVPADAAARVLEKIKLLEKDSYTKRAEGIRAFRESPLILLYADTVNAALSGKKTVEAIVRERLTKNRNAITIEDIQALQNLNTQLRF